MNDLVEQLRTSGIHLGDAIAGYRDNDNHRCAKALTELSVTVREAANEIERLREDVSRLLGSLRDAVGEARDYREGAEAEIERLRNALVRRQQPEGMREEQVAEWLRSRGYKVNA